MTCGENGNFTTETKTYYTIERKLGDVVPLELWASALCIINISAILLFGLLIKFEVGVILK